LAAVVVGYEIAGLVGEAIGGYEAHTARGWHSTGTVCTLGAAAAVATLLRLPATQFRHALAISASYASGIWAFIDDGSMTKRLHAGKAAEAGVMAALLAHGGMTGPARVFEAPWGGLLATYASGDARPEVLATYDALSFRITRGGLKPYACCYAVLAWVDAFRSVINELELRAEDIAGIEASGDEQLIRICGGRDIRTTVDAQLSLPYSLAVTARFGRAGLPEFDPPHLRDREITRIMHAVQMHEAPNVSGGPRAELRVHLRDGRAATRSLPAPPGAPERPLSDGVLGEKVKGLVGPRLGQDRAEQIISVVTTIDTAPDVQGLSRLLCRSCV
jgi:2-methylcitrate dehydratase PrpD